jgi:DNA topoisomerase-1
VNAYLKAISDSDISSKDFRTWGGTVRATRYLADVGRGETKAAVRAHIREAVKVASQALGNTPAVCRKSYIHPRIFECFEAGVVAEGRPLRGLRADERMALALLTAKVPTTAELLERSVKEARVQAAA